MLPGAMEELLNEQLHAEIGSAYLYLAMSAHFAAQGLPGFSHWMRQQAREELDHAMKLFDHLVDREGRVALTALDAPSADFGTVTSVFERALEHERSISASIHRLHETATKEGDHAALPLILWFIAEQVEEEKSVGQIVDQLRMADDRPGTLLFLDRHMGRRGS